MKRILFASLIMMCGSTFATSRNQDAISTIKGTLLRENYKQAYSQCDELTGTLEYLGQVVNKGAVKDPVKKQEVRLWILRQLGEVKEMQNTDKIVTEQTLIELLRTMRTLIVYLTAALERNFEDLEEFERPIIEDSIPNNLTTEQTEKVYKTLGTLLHNNKVLLKRMNSNISTLGLTSTNMFARWLDRINNRYGITDSLESLPRVLALSAAAMYLTPYKYFFENNIPGVKSLKNMFGDAQQANPEVPALGWLPGWQNWQEFDGEEVSGFAWLKRKLGTTKYWDPKGHTAIKYHGHEIPAKYNNPNAKTKKNGTLGDFLNSPEKKLFLGLVAGAGYLLLNDPAKEYFNPLKKYLRPHWNRLKGYNIPRIGKFRQPTITLDDPRLVGLESQIGQLKNIVRYITEPETFDRSASGLEKGILLTGPSRNGKTLTANALCGSINEIMQRKGMLKKFSFQEVKWSDVRWKGDGIKSILEEAKRNAPCVLFLDELHNLPLQVKEGGEVLSQFLTMSDSLQSTGINDAVIIIAATNRPYALDDALLKPGRFGLQIHFEKPTRELRKKYFTTMCDYNAINQDAFDLDQLARLTNGCSYGDLDMLFKSARFIARHENRSLRQEDFLHNVYEQVYRIRFDQDLPLSEDAHKLIAVHQAGHALMYMHYEQELNERLEMVTIRGQWSKIEEKRYLIDDVHKAHEQKKTKYGHLFSSKASETVDIGSSPLLKAKTLLAGAIAEEVLLGVTGRSYHKDDTRNALKVLEEYTFKGLSAEDYTKEEINEPKKEAKRLLRQCEKEVRDFLLLEKAALIRLSEALQKRLLLSYTEVKDLLEINGK